MGKQDVIYFSVNNWVCCEDYPPTENFKKWLSDDFDQSFRNDEWCKKNKLCVYYGTVDMSTNYTISAPREWVEKNCPELLTDDEYTYVVRYGKPTKKLFDGYECVGRQGSYKKKYSDFVYSQEDVDEGECDRVGNMPFREYCEANFGSEYYETGWWENDDDEDDEYYTDEEEEEEENLI